jgi:hypothetical protein
MPGLVLGIHEFAGTPSKVVDGRDKPGLTACEKPGQLILVIARLDRTIQ